MKPGVLALVFLGLLSQQTTAPKPFDPVGKYSFSTLSTDGSAVTGTMEISGTPGAYKGQASVSDGTVVTLTDVLTSPTGFIAVFDLQGGAAIVKLTRDQSGKFTGAWGQIAQSFNITAQKIGGQ